MDSVLGLVRHAGNDGLFKAMEMSLLATVSGLPLHLHAEGLRGTGKTTIMRAARHLLPRIRRIKGCLYNCDPSRPHCPHHRSLPPDQIAALGEEWVPMPFLEISHSAKVGTVVGSIDLGRLVSPTQPEAALLPGTIPQAHRGIIFVDEINRLAETAPELADILLDVMGTKPGRVQIEETGLPPVELPVQVTVWAASNPDEDPGPLEEIRRQLSDRFDFVIYTDRPGDPAVVEQILTAADGAGWHRSLSPADETQAELFRSRLTSRTAALSKVQVPAPLRQQVADLYHRFHVESLRAVQAIQLGMRLAACLEQRREAAAEDLARMIPLALRHRVDGEVLRQATAHLAGVLPRSEERAGAAPVPSNKPRPPHISLGGAAMDVQPARAEADLPRSGPAADKTAPAPVSPPWSTQYPSGPRTAEEQQNWLGRTLSGLRRNLGLPTPSPAPRPEAGGLRGGYQQRTQQGGQQGSQQAGAGQPGAAPRMKTADPLTVQWGAPPQKARPISSLRPDELIRTEEELGRQ